MESGSSELFVGLREETEASVEKKMVFFFSRLTSRFTNEVCTSRVFSVFRYTTHPHIQMPVGERGRRGGRMPALLEVVGFLLHTVKPFPSVRRLHAFASCLPWIVIASCCVFRVSCALCLPCKSSGTARIIGIQHVTRHKVRKDVHACFLDALPCPALPSCTNQPFVGYRKPPRCSEEGREGGDGKTVPFFLWMKEGEGEGKRQKARLLGRQ